MHGITEWQYRPYVRLYEIERAALPFICRLAPGKNAIEFEWRDLHDDGPHVAALRPRGAADAPWRIVPAAEPTLSFDGLDADCDYELKVGRAGRDEWSCVRLARTCDLPYTVVNYLHPDDPTYAFSGHSLCSPTLARLPSGALLAGMDVFAQNSGRNLTLLFRSRDHGRTWRYVCDIFPSFWPRLFVHRGIVYLFSATTDYGDMLIGRSLDEGDTWSAPVRLIPGSGVMDMGPHKAPMPVISHHGRLYTGVDYGAWKYRSHANGLLSIDENADLLDPAQWRYTPFLHYDPNWPDAPVGPCPGCIEGNAVVGPDGRIHNYLRIDHPDCVPSYGKAVVLVGDDADPEAPLRLDRIVDCPVGSNSKFEVYFDASVGKYIAIGNERGPDMPQRTVLSMAVSEDFYHWRIARRLIDCRTADPKHVAFQYPDWIFDGNDLLLLSRTAYGQSYNFHDANYITFHRIEDYRKDL